MTLNIHGKEIIVPDNAEVRIVGAEVFVKLLPAQVPAPHPYANQALGYSQGQEAGAICGSTTSLRGTANDNEVRFRTFNV